MNPWREFGTRRLWLSGIVVLFVWGSISACFYSQRTASPFPKMKTPKASSAFSHRMHEKVLKEERFQCTDCHLYDLAYMGRDKVLNEEITRAITRAGTESCHFCHIEHPERVQAALKCLDCHAADIRPIMPANHRAGWQSAHGTQLALSKVDCSQCHSNRFCIRCHARRDEADRSYHTGSALMSHPIEARVDPAKCQKCHQPTFCTRCHSFGRF